jgi:hypothetical protein
LEAPRALRYLAGEKVVGAAGDVGRAPRIRNGLDRRGVERQEHELHAAAVHLAQAVLLDVQDPLLKLGPDRVAEESLRIVERFGDREMLFQANLAFHAPTSLEFGAW